MKILDLNGLGNKGRDTLRYLCFGSIHINLLRKLLASDIQSFQSILDILERDCIIKRAQDMYEFHHQLKKDYCYERFLPSNIQPDYYVDIRAMYTEYRIRNHIEVMTNSHFKIFFDDNKELWPFEGDHLKDEYKKLSEPRLREKVNWLLFEASEDLLPNAIVEILYQYANILEKDDILYALDELLHDCYRIELEGELGTLQNVNFHSLRKIIEQIFSIKKINDFEQYHDNHYKRVYFNIKIRIEIEELLLTFHERYNIIDFENYPYSDELSTPIFKLTDIFLNNRNFLLETYETLENIYFYFEFAKEKEYDDAPQRYLRLHDEIDIYKSFIHLLALLILAEQKKKDEYTVQYLGFLDKLLSALPPEMEMNSETIEFLEFHKNFVLKQYPGIADRISDLINTVRNNFDVDMNN